MHALSQSRLFRSLRAAILAGPMAVRAKVGVTQIESNFATFLRSIVVTVAPGVPVFATGPTQPPSTIPTRTLVFPGLSGLATGASWLCHFWALQIGKAAQGAPVDTLSVVFVAPIGAGAGAGAGLMAMA